MGVSGFILLKNCSITLCITASPEPRPSTLEWWRSTRRPRERSSYRHKCLQKPRRTIKTDSQWVVAKRGDRAKRLIMDWLKRNKDDHRTLDQYLKHQVPDAECRIYAARQKDFILRRNLLYLRVSLKKVTKMCWYLWCWG